jgi:hypothetical protein
MQRAYERKRKYDATGQCREDEQSIGQIVVWGLVAIVALLAGKALVNLPPNFWDHLTR